MDTAKIDKTIRSIMSQIDSLSEEDQHTLFNFIKSNHDEDPFHQVDECPLCDGYSACLYCCVCSGCRKRASTLQLRINCVKCEDEFIVCRRGKDMCASKILLMWNCDCKMDDLAHSGICNRCARDEPFRIKCQIRDPRFQCEAVVENPYAVPTTKRAT
jgi:hypothetical protein